MSHYGTIYATQCAWTQRDMFKYVLMIMFTFHALIPYAIITARIMCEKMKQQLYNLFVRYDIRHIWVAIELVYRVRVVEYTYLRVAHATFMFAIKCTILVVFGLHVRSQVFASDWVKLLPIQPVGDSMKMHSDHLSDSSPLRQRTTTKHPDLHRVGLAAESHHHSVNPIKYADLEHIVGPGFEKDLERYYNQHKHELDESTRRTPKPSEGHHFQTYDPSNDPWSIYDKPINFKTTSNSSDSTERGGDRFSLFDSDVFEKPTIVSFITKPSISTLKSVTTAKPLHSNSTATKHTKPKYFKLVQLPVGYQQVPTSSSSLFGFPSILQFFRRFQNSLVTNTARSIQDKIKMLESFRDDLMSNISDIS